MSANTTDSPVETSNETAQAGRQGSKYSQAQIARLFTLSTVRNSRLSIEESVLRALEPSRQRTDDEDKVEALRACSLGRTYLRCRCPCGRRSRVGYRVQRSLVEAAALQPCSVEPQFVTKHKPALTAEQSRSRSRSRADRSGQGSHGKLLTRLQSARRRWRRVPGGEARPTRPPSR
jgi:hypothetical protein